MNIPITSMQLVKLNNQLVKFSKVLLHVTRNGKSNQAKSAKEQIDRAFADFHNLFKIHQQGCDFIRAKSLDFDKQQGVAVEVKIAGEMHHVNVWCDLISNPTLRVDLDSHESLLVNDCALSNFIAPLVTFEHERKTCYITFSHSMITFTTEVDGLVIRHVDAHLNSSRQLLNSKTPLN